MKVVFAIARVENVFSYFDEVCDVVSMILQNKVGWVPYAQINTPPMQKKKGKAVAFPQTRPLNPSELLNWVNKMLKMEVLLTVWL